VVEVIAAGQVASRPLARGETMRIMTGACIPEGADAVQQFEITERLGEGKGERVGISRPARPGDNIRAAGADISEGMLVLEPGRALTPHDISILSSLGLPQVTVTARPRVTVLSTGDELLDVDAPLRPGAIRDSNLLMLSMLVEEAGGMVVRAERLPDDVNRVREAVQSAIGACDAVLTIGGVSAGDFDPVKLALAEIGGIALWRVAMKPGRPQAFGVPAGTLFYGLPGNPASVASVFEVLVRPALLRMQRSSTMDRPQIAVKAATPMASRSGRRDFIRVTLELRAGVWWATPAGGQTSGHLLPQSRAHALAIIPEENAQMNEGNTMQALVLRWPQSLHGGNA
jgi:molybdopterin molybdotransferase